MRLIDADALLKGRQDHEMISTHVIWNAPTIDAVPVVRCKDCKIRYTDHCGMFDVEAEWEWTEDNGFCQYGERREE